MVSSRQFLDVSLLWDMDPDSKVHCVSLLVVWLQICRTTLFQWDNKSPLVEFIPTAGQAGASWVSASPAWPQQRSIKIKSFWVAWAAYCSASGTGEVGPSFCSSLFAGICLLPPAAAEPCRPVHCPVGCSPFSLCPHDSVPGPVREAGRKGQQLSIQPPEASVWRQTGKIPGSWWQDSWRAGLIGRWRWGQTDPYVQQGHKLCLCKWSF